MASFHISTKGNLITVTQKQFGKIEINERELQVFEENLIPGLFRPKLLSKRKLIYTAPAGISLEQYIKKNMSIHKFYSILAQVVEITKIVERYHFYLHNLVMESKLIYLKELTGELFFIYEPVKSKSNTVNVFGFLLELVSAIKTEDRKLKEECEETIHFLEDTEHYRINEIEQFIARRYPQIYQQIIRSSVEEADTMSGDGIRHLKQEEGTVLLELEEEGTMLLMEEEGTVLLNRQNMESAHIKRRKSGQIMDICKKEFCIGKDTSSDFMITDNPAISRRHATITNYSGDYLLTDQNSKNHTYVNGVPVLSGSGTPLHSGDIIRLADEEFEFYLS